MKERKLNIKWHTLKSKKERTNEFARLANMLSIYSYTPIRIGKTNAESLAGFFAGIYYPENDSRRREAFHTWGSRSIYLRTKLTKLRNGNLIYWDGKSISAGSKEHYKIIEQAIRAKFEQNKEARDALISVQGMELSSRESNPGGKYKIPPEIFCETLVKLRDEFAQRASSNFL